MNLMKTVWPRTLAEVYKRGQVLLPSRSSNTVEPFRIIDVRPPGFCEWYLASGGYANQWLATGRKSAATTRIILEKVS